MPTIKSEFRGDFAADIIAASAICELDAETFVRLAIRNAIREAQKAKSLVVYTHHQSTGLQYRGNACRPRATRGTVRHFFALDSEIGRAVVSYRAKNRRSRAARDAARVWADLRSLAGLSVAEKANGQNLQVFTRKAAVRGGAK